MKKIAFFVAVAATVALTLLILVIPRKTQPPPKLEISEPAPPEGRLEAQWCQAVIQGESSVALSLAGQLCEPVSVVPTPPEYVALCKLNNVDPSFLNLGFNKWDFQSWSHAFFFSKLAHKIIGENPQAKSPIATLMTVVHETIEPHDPEGITILWPHTIWEQKMGTCDRQTWLLCDLAYQLGYDTQVVYLRDPETKISPHTICEVRKDGKTWVADPLSGILLPGVTVADLATNPRLAFQTWPERPDWQKAITTPDFWIPAYPQDYRSRNQRLYQKVSQFLGESCPRFGEPPVRRLERSVSLAAGSAPKFYRNYWGYPFRLLLAEALAEGNQSSSQSAEADK